MRLLQLYFEHCLSLFQQEKEQSSPGCDYFLAVADKFTIRLRFAEQRLVRPILRSLAHLEIAPVENADLTICIWDSASSPRSVPPYPSWDDRKFSGAIGNGPFQVFCSVNPNSVSLLDGERNIGLFWIEDMDKLPWYELARALRDIIRSYALRRDMQMVHAACIGKKRSGVIIAGPTGAGKSTTALSSLTSPLEYLADDLCLIGRDGSEVRAYALYNTGKLNHFDRLPHLERHTSNPNRIASEKAVIFVHEEFPQKMANSVGVSAICVSEVMDGEETVLRPVSSDVALRGLFNSTKEALIDMNVQDFFALYKICSTVPCYLLQCGRDLEALNAKLADLLDKSGKVCT